MAKKKFIIIQSGTSIFPENGKKRVRVFQDDEFKGVPPELQQQLEDYNETVKEGTEAQEDNNDAAEKALQIQKDLAAQGGITRKQLSDVVGILKEQLGAYDNVNEATSEYQAVVRNIVTAETELAKARAEGNEVLVKQLERSIAASQERKESLESITEEGKKVSEGAKAVADALLRQNSILVENEEDIRQSSFALEKLSDSSFKTGLALNTFSSVLSMAGAEQLDFSKGGFAMVTSMINMGHEFEKQAAAVERNSGLLDQSVEVQKSLVSENYHLGISTEQAGKALTSLNQGFSAFSGLTAEAQKEMASTVLTMEKLGVSGEASAKAIDLLNRSMGLSVDGAKEALESFDGLAQELALPTSQVVDDFTKIGPKLARFGKDGKKQFEMLAKQARSLGVDVTAAFEIGEAFDTFEGAADLAGKLNAQLGLQINSVEMMKLSHAERIKMLQEEFRTSGKNFDQMDRRQKQAIAEMMGVDVDMAAKLFGDPVKYAQYQKDQELAAERAERLTTVQERLAVMGDRLIQAFSPFFTLLSAVMVIFTLPGIPQLIALVTAAVGIFTTFHTIRLALLSAQAIGVAQTKKELALQIIKNGKDKIANGLEATKAFFRMKKVAETPAVVAANELEAKSEDKVTQAKIRGAGATTVTGTAAGFAVGPMLALAAAILMIGLGVGAAALGMSYFVESFSKLSVEQMIGASAGLIGLALALYFLIPAMIGFATGSVFAIKAMYAIGAAVALIGIGIGAAAAGIGLLISSITNVGEGITVTAEGMEKLTQVVKATTEVDQSQLENAQGVFDKIVSVMVESRTASVPALTELANAVGSAPAGGQADGGRERTIQLKVNERILGDVVVNIMKERYDLTPR